MYERSGGRRSSLYEGENNDPAGDFNRSAYGFNTSRSVFVMHNPKVFKEKMKTKPGGYPFTISFFLNTVLYILIALTSSYANI